MTPQKIVDFVLTASKQLGVDEAEASYHEVDGFSVSVRLEEIELAEYNREKSISLTVFKDFRTASVSTTDLSTAGLTLAVNKAQQLANFTEKDLDHGLASPELLAYSYPNLDIFHPWDISIPKAIELAIACEHAGLKTDPRITNSEGCRISSHNYLHAYGNSNNFYGEFTATLHGLNCTLVAEENGNMQRDFDYTAARSCHGLTDFATLGRNAANNTLKRLNPQILAPRKCPIIFAARVATTLFEAFTEAINGEYLYRKLSFLTDHLGKKVFPSFINIYEQPHLLKGLHSAPFDLEGVKTSTKYFIENGVIQNYILNSYTARKLKMQPTGNAGGTFNLFVNSSPHDLASLLKLMDKGLLVVELLGHGVNLINGDYSQGAFGFWVEHGEIQYPVNEITIAGNLKDMFANIIAIGNDVDHNNNINTGSVLIENISVAGNL